MTAIIGGKLVRGDLARVAMGGTELMALRMIKHFDPELLSKVNIVHQRVDDRLLNNGKPNILVLHDLPNDPSAQHLKSAASRARFAAICPVSDWQAQMYNVYLGVPYSTMRVMNNFIERVDDHEQPREEHGPVKIIYHTTPHRGLQLLVPAFFSLVEVHPDIELHLYSSFKIYGWDERDVPYKELFMLADQHPKIFNHGTVDNDIIRKVLPTMDIYAYPSIWPECHSLAMIEAMCAGVTIVSNNYASLPETMMGHGYMADYSEDHQVHANRFASLLDGVVSLYKDQSSRLHVNLANDIMAAHAHDRYTVERMVPKWNALLAEILS